MCFGTSGAINAGLSRGFAIPFDPGMEGGLMTIRTILAAASGGTASDGAIEAACRLARRFEAHVEGLHIRADAAQLVMAAGDGFGMPIAGQFIDKFNADVTAA